MLAPMVAQQLRRDALGALRPHRRPVLHAVLQAELHVEQSQEVPDLGGGRDRALAAAARQALLDRDRGWNAVDRVDLRPAGRLHDAAGVRVERFEVAALPLVEQDVERQGRLAGPRHPRHDAELATRDGHVERLQVVLSRVDDLDAALGGAACVEELGLHGQARAIDHGRPGLLAHLVRQAHRDVVVGERPAGVGARMALHVFRGAGADDRTAALPAFRPEVDQPVGSADHVEIVFDDDQRVTGVEQLAERAHQLGDVVEMQAGGGLVEHEERAAAGQRLAARARRLRTLGEEAGELQALRLAARQGRQPAGRA